jgi:signal transduction histidine kinase
LDEFHCASLLVTQWQNINNENAPSTYMQTGQHVHSNEQNFQQAAPKLGWYALVLALIAAGVVLLAALLIARSPRLVILVVLPVTLVSVLGAALASGALWRAKLAASPPLILLGNTLGGMAGGLIGFFVGRMFRAAPLDQFAAGGVMARVIIGSSALGFVVGLALLLLLRLREREMDLIATQSQLAMARERAEKEHVLADMKVLQAQIEPHFLYNTLANLRQLIRTDSAAALALLEQLTRYFKFSIPSFHEKYVRLSEELALCEAYVEIMRIRTAQPIGLVLDVPPALENSDVLPGMLLTLVENVVKHGLPAEGAARIRIRVVVNGEMLAISVADNGPGIDSVPGGTVASGVGLANIRNRLQLLFGTRASLSITNADLGGCEIMIRLPYKLHGD